MAPLKMFSKFAVVGLLAGTMYAQEKPVAPQVEVDQNTARFLEAAKAKTQTAGQPQTEAQPQIQPDPPKAADTVQGASANAAGEDAAAANAPNDSPKSAKNKGKVKKPKKKKEKAPKLTP